MVTDSSCLETGYNIHDTLFMPRFPLARKANLPNFCSSRMPTTQPLSATRSIAFVARTPPPHLFALFYAKLITCRASTKVNLCNTGSGCIPHKLNSPYAQGSIVRYFPSDRIFLSQPFLLSTHFYLVFQFFTGEKKIYCIYKSICRRTNITRVQNCLVFSTLSKYFLNFFIVSKCIKITTIDK